MFDSLYRFVEVVPLRRGQNKQQKTAEAKNHNTKKNPETDPDTGEFFQLLLKDTNSGKKSTTDNPHNMILI